MNIPPHVLGFAPPVRLQDVVILLDPRIRGICASSGKMTCRIQSNKMKTKPPIDDRPTEDEIREYAHHLYVSSGWLPGRDLDNWLAAEAHLMEEWKRKHPSGKRARHHAAPAESPAEKHAAPAVSAG